MLRTLLVLALAASVRVAAADVDRGASAPGFTAKDTAGKAVTLADLKDKQNVLLMFWSANCPTSLSDLPAIQKMADGLKEKPLTILALNEDDYSASQLAGWAKKHKVTLRLLVDPKFKIWRSYEADATPTYVLIDKQGTIQARYPGGGEQMRTELSKGITEILESGKVSDRPELPAPKPG